MFLRCQGNAVIQKNTADSFCQDEMKTNPNLKLGLLKQNSCNSTEYVVGLSKQTRLLAQLYAPLMSLTHLLRINNIFCLLLEGSCMGVLVQAVIHWWLIGLCGCEVCLWNWCYTGTVKLDYISYIGIPRQLQYWQDYVSSKFLKSLLWIYAPGKT